MEVQRCRGYLERAIYALTLILLPQKKIIEDKEEIGENIRDSGDHQKST